MYKQSFGSKKQIIFNSEGEFYEFLGYLTKNDGTTVLVWEFNDKSGAWAQEGRILFFSQPQNLRADLSQTAGVGRIVSRVNCNEFIENLKQNHSFVLGEIQDVAAVRNTVPQQFLGDFDNGRQL
ncbi:hypothetical protein [Maribacter arenosus]|uniref:Uncharacterized protein n=1 Tax=Maribacter arenosus TaxID=1854708 RepID=A0ABR7VEE4_9FLAO|nr:hypothetical protein [Maribacter arenosus]MBD0850517.1 hypothetical protein [Maribacter arenosus]